MIQKDYGLRITMILLFGVAIGYFEASVVVYLRELYYPYGFTFPLRIMPRNVLVVEALREIASIVILFAVAGIAGKRHWERFGYFMILFGTWDIFYYVWLYATLRWPSSLVDFDVLFLLPIPWIGPVIAPILVSILLIVAGLAITGSYARGFSFKPDPWGWVLGFLGIGTILYTFMRDTGAALEQQMPRPFLYSLFMLGLLLCIGAFLMSFRKTSGAWSK